MSITEEEMEIRMDLVGARNEHDRINNKLLTFEAEKNASPGKKIFNIPVQYSVHTTVTAYGDTLEEAIEWAESEMSTPTGDYLDDSWVSNPFDDSEEDLLAGTVQPQALLSESEMIPGIDK